MEKEESKSVIEAILFAAGREASIQELSMALEKPTEEIESIIKEMQEDSNKSEQNRTIAFIFIRLYKVQRTFYSLIFFPFLVVNFTKIT